MNLKRLLYLIYYFRETDFSRLYRFISFVKSKGRLSKSFLFFDMIRCSLKYNISLLEYFLFHFYSIDDHEKNNYAGTGYMYEFQKVMNPKSYRDLLENKLKFLNVYKDYVHHDFISLTDLESNPEKGKKLLNNNSGKLVIKNSKGQCGIGVEIINVKEFNQLDLIQKLKLTQNDLVEEFVIQHDELIRLSPSGLNTIRIITQIDKNNNVVILAARLRISINSNVDNLAAGNIAASINLESGEVKGPGVYSDITKPDEYNHPVTGLKIIGFKIPFWNETLDMIKSAALLDIKNRSVGWDVAITNHGPELIEGNHDWCKLLWQLPVKMGLKSELEVYKNGIQ